MHEIQLDYQEFKAIANKKELFWQHVDKNTFYDIFMVDGPLKYSTIVWKTTENIGGINVATEEANLADYEASFLSTSNRRMEYRVVPDNVFQMQADAVTDTIPFGTLKNIDFKIENHGIETYTTKYLAGAEIKTKNGADGDYAVSQIIDIDNVLGYGENFIIKSYVRKKFMFPDKVQTIIGTAPGAIPVGLYIRVVYHSVGTSVDPTIYINYDIKLKN